MRLADGGILCEGVHMYVYISFSVEACDSVGSTQILKILER